MRAVRVGVVASHMAIGAAGASAQEIAIIAPETATHSPKSIVDYGPVEPPPAFKIFCREMPEECIPRLRQEGLTNRPAASKSSMR